MVALQSDVSINYKAFEPASVPPKIHEINEQMRKDLAQSFDFDQASSAAQFRRLQEEGKVFGGEAPPHPAGESFSIPSRDHGRIIPCRVFKPTGATKPSAIFLHIHGGGYVLHTEKYMDNYLHRLSTSMSLACISVGYRLAPEDKFPAALHDCIDCAEWLIENGSRTFGAELGFISGESAGGHATLLTTLHLLQASKHASHKLKGIIPNYPLTDASHLPATKNLSKSPSLVLDERLLEEYIKTFLPKNMSLEDRKSPSISPLYAELRGLRLPPALFTVGTEDILLEDSLFMSVRWLVAGGVAIVKAMPGAPHGYLENADLEADENIKGGIGHIEQFIATKLKRIEVLTR